MSKELEPFKWLVMLAARAFYDDITIKGNNQPETGQIDTRGIAVVVLDALTRQQWVREKDLAKNLKLHSKQLRRTLKFLEEEKLITRDHRERAKGGKIHSYFSLDYAQIYDVVRYRLHHMKKQLEKKQLKDELEVKNTVQEYICLNCTKRYTSFDAQRIVSFEDEYFHCENCNGELVAESDKLGAAQGGDGDDNANKCRREKLKDMLQRMEVQLKPLMEQLSRVKDLEVPENRTLLAWEAGASAENGNLKLNGNDLQNHYKV